MLASGANPSFYSRAGDCENDAWQVGLALRAENGSLILCPRSGDAFFQHAEAFADEVERVSEV